MSRLRLAFQYKINTQFNKSGQRAAKNLLGNASLKAEIRVRIPVSLRIRPQVPFSCRPDSGLRIYPLPAFPHDTQSRRRWDGKIYPDDPTYFSAYQNSENHGQRM
jgi:hypothetical protein